MGGRIDVQETALTRPAIIFLAALIAYTVLFTFVGEALTAPLSDHHAVLVTEQIQARERHAAHRRLRQRYLEWMQWRRAEVRRRVHDWAVAELGTRESGYNVVPRYGVYGWPWCGTFAARAVSASEQDRPLPPNPNSASSWRWAIREQCRGLARIYQRCNVRPGDVVTFWYGHVGIVHRTGRNGFWSIEGNVSDAVGLRWHPWSSADTFGRLRVVAVPERFKCL